jgi:dTDP-4-dehydrorhamnose reductase
VRILLTGRTGQVGWELARSLLPLGDVIALGRAQADLADPEALRPVVRDARPEVIVNAAAYTAVDRAEDEEDLATRINGGAPGVLAEEAARCGALLVHFSTDYVFDGRKAGPYSEDDVPNPINAYGRTKLAGERAIQAAGGDFLILRTSWVYATRGHNFLRTILRLAREREELKVVADQMGAPNWARFIAEASAHVLRQAQAERTAASFDSGLFHLTSNGHTSWYGFATAIVDAAVRYLPEGTVKARRIESIATKQYPTPAKRPMDSCLASCGLAQRFGLVMPAWERALELCMEGLS